MAHRRLSGPLTNSENETGIRAPQRDRKEGKKNYHEQRGKRKMRRKIMLQITSTGEKNAFSKSHMGKEPHLNYWYITKTRERQAEEKQERVGRVA